MLDLCICHTLPWDAPIPLSPGAVTPLPDPQIPLPSSVAHGFPWKNHLLPALPPSHDEHMLGALPGL